MFLKKKTMVWFISMVFVFQLLMPVKSVKAQLCAQQASCAFYTYGEYCLPDFFCCWWAPAWFAPSCYWILGACINPDQGVDVETHCSIWGDLYNCYCIDPAPKESPSESKKLSRLQPGTRKSRELFVPTLQRLKK